jgi:hypothetical protein
LVRETEPPKAFAALSAREAAGDAQVLQQVRIDALDITVLKGGGADVAKWATEHGFRLSPDAPEVLEFYAQRSPIFLAAVFDGQAAQDRGQRVGDGTPVHLTIPTSNPWVPLRILALGRQPSERVEADVFLLTDGVPALLPGSRSGFSLQRSDAARKQLLDDLRADDGMGWVPASAWLTKLRVDMPASDLRFDLAVDASGMGRPSPVAAGLEMPPPVSEEGLLSGTLPWGAVASFAALLVFVAIRRWGERRAS